VPVDQYLKDQKKQLRRQMRQLLKQVRPQQRQQASKRAAETLCQADEYRRSRTIMVFLAMPTEIDTVPVIERAFDEGKVVCAPRVDWRQHLMRPIRITSLTEGLVETEYGYLEPGDGPVVAIDQIDLVLVPGLAFDLQGNRLGRGAGFFDRFLSDPRCRAFSTGYAFQFQVVSRVPCGPNDRRIDALVTEQRFVRFS